MLSLQCNWWVQTWVIYNVQWTVSLQSNNYYPAQSTVRMVLLSWLFCLPGWACKSIWRFMFMTACRAYTPTVTLSSLLCIIVLLVFTHWGFWELYIIGIKRLCYVLTRHDYSVNNTDDNSNNDKCILYQFEWSFELQFLFFFYILKGTFVLQPEVNECWTRHWGSVRPTPHSQYY